MGNFTVDFPHRAADQQPQPEGAGGVILLQASANPQVLHMGLGLGIQHHTAENAAESEKVLIFQPGGAAVLVNLHTQPVIPLPEVGCQIELRWCEAVLSIAHKGIQHHTAENAAESEKVLIFQPGGAAVLVNLHTQPVIPLPEVGCQIELRWCEAVLSIAHKVPVEPHIEGPLHSLKADADGFSQQARFQIKA